MELRGVRLIGDSDKLRVSSGRIMAAYLDRRRRNEADEPFAVAGPALRPRRSTPEAVKTTDPERRWVVSGFFLISSAEVKRWSGSTKLSFEAAGMQFHVVSLTKWTSSPSGFETWNFRALCLPTEAQLEHLPVIGLRRNQAVNNPDLGQT